jgi:quercetin dioxygenase-like cupin family protein
MLRRSIPAALLVALALALPVGALAHGAAPAGPAVAYQAIFPNLTMAGQFDELMVVLDFAPGAGVPLHVHGGPTLVTVLDGAITLTERGMQQSYRAGESWTETPGNRHEAVNGGATPARVVVSFLVPKGAEATTLVTPGLPNTGAGGAADWTAVRPAATILGPALTLIALLGWRLRRRSAMTRGDRA